jgi:acetolactate decarboxylase
MKAKILIIMSWFIISCTPGQTKNHEVRSISAMKNVMWKGELEAKIKLDTILPHKSLYGLGPLENLSGEITIIDGIPYVSTISEDQQIKVEVNKNVGAPFFVYGTSKAFESIELPQEVVSLKTLNSFLKNYHDSDTAYIFKLIGDIDYSKIHVQNLKPNSVVSSPEEAHRGQVNTELNSIKAKIIGFYSNNAHGIYTHHDTNIHAHLITEDKKYMGHCDLLRFKHNQVKLYIAKNR